MVVSSDASLHPGARVAATQEMHAVCSHRDEVQRQAAIVGTRVESMQAARAGLVHKLACRRGSSTSPPRPSSLGLAAAHHASSPSAAPAVHSPARPRPREVAVAVAAHGGTPSSAEAVASPQDVALAAEPAADEDEVAGDEDEDEDSIMTIDGEIVPGGGRARALAGSPLVEQAPNSPGMSHIKTKP